MQWSALQYNKAWDILYESCDTETQETADRRLDFVKDHGNASRQPITRHLDDGIFELRAKDARFLFYFADLQRFIFVHGLIKKRGNVPPEDIKFAKKQRTEIRALKVNLDAISH
jgi:phage-related protein